MIKFKYRKLLQVLLIFLILGCSKYPDSVNIALKLAKDNKSSLVKVLEFYRESDSLKFEAACFLISNMPYHFSPDKGFIDDEYFNYFIEVDSLFFLLRPDLLIGDYSVSSSKICFDSIKQLMAKKLESISQPTISNTLIPDIQIINSEYLIDNIESAFSEWENNPLIKHFTFEQFKEFVLPYRVGSEFPFLKRSRLKHIISGIINIEKDERITTAINNYIDYVKITRWINEYVASEVVRGPFQPFLPLIDMDCYNDAIWTVNLLRANGIPVAFEYTNQWPDRPSQHFWCVSPDENQILKPYTAPYNNLGGDWDHYLRYAGKVYRENFAINKKSPYFNKTSHEFIPKNLDKPNLSDVSSAYHPTITLRLPLTIKTKNKLAYLCLFKNNNRTPNDSEHFNPVAWGNIDHNKNEIIFEQVPLNTLFFPSYFDGNRLVLINEPFILKSATLTEPSVRSITDHDNKDLIDLRLKNNKLFWTDKNKQEINDSITYKSFSPNTYKNIDIRALRKYPLKRNLQEYRNQMKGSFLLGSNKLEGPYDTLFIFTDIPKPYIQEYPILNNAEYKYYSFYPSDTSQTSRQLHIAHYELLGPYSELHTNSVPNKLPIFNIVDTTINNELDRFTIHGFIHPTVVNINNAFDNNLETFTRPPKIIIEYNFPVKITHLRLAPRNANNMIIVDDVYQFYYFSSGKWKYSDTQVAKYNYLIFRDIPDNTIYWLRNISRGREELPFFYEDDKQVFINRMK